MTDSIIETVETTNKELVDLFQNWSSIIDKSKLILLDDYVFKDPLIKKMKPMSAYVYTLGLELALDYSIDSIESILNQNSDISDEQLQEFPLEINNKIEFLKNIKQSKQLIANRTQQLTLHECKLCEFKSETQVVLDHHLTQPHFYSTIFQCNFCTHFRSNSKEDYKAHVLKIHKRACYIEKPLVQCMCSNCNYECGNDIEKLLKHELTMCPLRPNLFNSQSHNLLAPNRIDLLQFEYLFNEKPINMNSSSNILLDMTSYMTSSHATQQWLYESNQNLQTKITESLINDKRASVQFEKPCVVSVTKPSHHNSNGLIREIQPILNTLTKTVTKSMNIPNKDLIISIEACNNYRCHICSMKFLGEFRLKSLIDHLRLYHQIVDKMLTKTIQDYILPQINKTSVQQISPVQASILPINKPTVIKISNKNEILQLNFNVEKQLICEILKNNKSNMNSLYWNDIDQLIDTIFEIKVISGRCYKCNLNNLEPNLLLHLKNFHNLDIAQITSNLNCLFCGDHFINREKLIIHQLKSHKTISFISVNKLFTTTDQIKINNSKILKVSSPEFKPVLQQEPIIIVPRPEPIKQIETNVLTIEPVAIESVTPFVSPLNSSNSVGNHLEKGSSLRVKREKISAIFKKQNDLGLKPVFHHSNDAILIENLDNLYGKNQLKNKRKRDSMSKQLQEDVELNIENIKRNKLEYNCVKCSILFQDIKDYKEHLSESHNLFKEKNTDSVAFNYKVMPTTQTKVQSNEIECFFCTAKFKSNIKYQTHLQSSHMKIATVRLKKVDISKIIFIEKKQLSTKNSFEKKRKSHRRL